MIHVGVYVTLSFQQIGRSTRRVILSISSHQPQGRFNPCPVLRLTIMIRITKSPVIPLRRRFLATHTATAPPTAVAAPPTRHDWTKEEVQRIYDTPLLDLVFRSASVHRQYHDPTKIQLCTLMNIKSKLVLMIGIFKKNSKSDLQVGAVAKTVRSAQ